MEELSDDDARDLASDWVKRIQNSLLTAGDDVRTPGVVRAHFGSNDGRMYTNHEFQEESGKIDYPNPRLGSTFLADSDNSLSFSQFPVHTGTSVVGEEPISSLECTSKQSNVDRSFHVKTTDQQEELLTKKTPRPDADFIRQRRLAFFERSVRLQEKSDLSLFQDKNGNVSKHIPASQLPQCDHETRSSSFQRFDLHPGSYAKQEMPDKMNKLESLESPLSCSFNGGSSHVMNTGDYPYQYRSPQAAETDEEEIRLELWGLKEAVHSGELDLNAYLKEPTWKDHRLFSGSSCQLENNYHDNSKSGNVPQRDTHLHFHDKTRTANDIPDSGGYNQSYFNAVYDEGRGIRTDDHSQCHLNDKIANGLPFVCQDEDPDGIEFHGPEPQINGPLYSGFENSDSETSLLSFGSKCDDVHYSKIVKKQNASIANEMIHSSPGQKVHIVNKKQEHKHKQKRGKDKILLELTEFIEGCGTPKDTKNSKQNSGSSDLHLRFPAGTPKAASADGLYEGHTQNEFIERGEASLSADPSSTSENNTAQSHDRKQTSGMSAPSECRENLFGKICPQCDEVNSKAANWCIECGTALICVKASCLTAEQEKVFEKQCEETQKLIKETLKTPLNFSRLLAYDKAEKEERSLSNDISNLSLQVSQSTSNLEEARYRFSSSPQGYKRRWMRSSIAWSTYNSGELTKSPSFVKDQSKTKARQRATSFSDLTTYPTKEKGSKHKRNSRNKSLRKRTVSCSSFVPGDEALHTLEGFTNVKECGDWQNNSLKSSQKGKPRLSHVVQRANPPGKNQIKTITSTQGHNGGHVCNGMINAEGYSSHSLLKSSSVSSIDDGPTPSSSQIAKTTVPPLSLKDVDSYDRILTLIRSQRDSEPVPYLYLPDEILLQIFSFLPHKDLVSCSRVCSQFYRISMDETLWRVIVLIKNDNVTDEWLCAIGKRRPISLTISHCHSNKVTAKGLRDLFRNCSDSLEELNFSHCRGGELIGESILLHVAARCCWLRSVDASWSNVSDNGVQALVDNVKRLECLCLNGCQAVTDESIKCVANKHGKTLRIFEVFGCFKITPAGLRILGQTCQHLQTLNIGQCHKITDSAIGSLVSSLPELENLDLRGCKQIRDSAVKKIVRHCPLVTTLVLANCPLISDVSLTEIATNLPRIRTLDICGCSRVSDNGICALSKRCQRLEHLDLSSTGVGHKSVLSLANYCSQSLRSLKLSFCPDIYENTVVHLAKHCKRLTTLHLYDCKRIRNTSNLRLLNPALTIEC